MRFVRGADEALRYVSLGMSAISALWIGALGVLVISDILGRAILDQPLRGVVEIAKTSIVAITFLAVPYAMRRGTHIRSGVVVDRVPPRIRAAMNAFAAFVSVGMFALLVKAMWSPMLHAWRSGEFEGEGALRVPTAPTKTIIVVASVIMVLESLRRLLIAVNDARRGEGAPA